MLHFKGNLSHIRAGACSEGTECPSRPAGQTGELSQGRSTNVNYLGDPKVTQDHCRLNSRGHSCGDLGVQLGKGKEAPIIDTGNVEGVQDKRLWLVGRIVVGGLTTRRGGDLDDAIPTLPR